MPISCDIKFDGKEPGLYFSGQTVTGQITLNLDKQKTVKGISVKISGYAVTSWSHRSYHHRHHRERRRFEGREDYINTTTYLLGSHDAPGRVTLEPGTYNYKFECNIPENCPSSFESTNGHVRYMITVVLERPWKFDESFPVGFTVLKTVDLNTDTSVIKTPIRMEASKMLSAGFFSNKPLTLKAYISQNGYVPGQAVVVNASVDNETNTAVKGVRFALNLIVTYISQVPREETRVEKINLVKIRTEPIDKQSKKNFTEILRLPPTPPTCGFLSKIIKIAYEVDVMAKLPGISISPTVVIPIIVGNVPLANPPPPIVEEKLAEATTVSTAPNSLANPVAGTSREPSAPESNLNSDPDALPPTYEEAMFTSNRNGSNSDDDDDDISESQPVIPTFAPKYPVLDMSSVEEGILVDLSTEQSNAPSAGGPVSNASGRRTPTKQEYILNSYNN